MQDGARFDFQIDTHAETRFPKWLVAQVIRTTEDNGKAAQHGDAEGAALLARTCGAERGFDREARRKAACLVQAASGRIAIDLLKGGDVGLLFREDLRDPVEGVPAVGPQARVDVVGEQLQASRYEGHGRGDASGIPSVRRMSMIPYFARAPLRYDGAMPFSRRCALASLLGGLRGILAGQSGEWTSLFDGKSLGGWKEAPIPGHGTVQVKDGAIWLGKGYMTGIAWTREFPKTGYEVRFEAVRAEGDDFFAAITFPVGASFCSWINGGWGGQMVGLSNLDGQDASENDTSTSLEFQNGRWYAFLLEVTDKQIRCRIDGKLMIDVEIAGREVALRAGEIELCAPLGFASYSTLGGLRKLEYRRLPGERTK
jgi:hypothetical protein